MAAVCISSLSSRRALPRASARVPAPPSAAGAIATREAPERNHAVVTLERSLLVRKEERKEEEDEEDEEEEEK
ncbi:hypothetical protein EYF80_060852 [Liparis tanakae]|uniref:Uncharacterized protein n=1 Tax=Liparis tanakae TaxID=230148 RepID=A0A4Z2EKA6_9TELE|nr:hypothetical protein EYF80_060852 [Liparis tanakae]